MDFAQFFDTSDPNNAMTLGMLSGLLQSSGKSTTPTSFGQTLSSALQGGMQGQQMAQQAAYRNMQAQQMKQTMERQKRMDDMVAGVFGGQGAPIGTSNFQQGENAGIPNGQTPQMQQPMPHGMPQGIPQGIGQADINKLAMLRAMGGQDLLPFYQEANKPQVIEQGKTYRYKDGRSEYMPQLPEGAKYDPQTGAITEVQGYTPMMARRTGAIEGAKQWAGVQPAIATTQGQEWAKVAPQTALAGNQAAITSQNTPMEVVAPSGQKVILPRSSVLGGRQDQQGGLLPFVAQEAPDTAAWKTGRAEQGVKDFTTIQSNAASAADQLARVSRIDQLLNDVGGGKLDPLGREVASAANSLGLKIDSKLGNKQAAEALAVEMALSMRQTGTGVMTDKDYEAFRNTAPDLAKTPEGRMQISTTIKGFMNRDIQEANMANAYREKYGKVDDNFYSQLNQWRQANPIFGGK